MRVLTVGNMYPPHHLGGYELMWRSFVEHMQEWGHEVRVLTTDYRSPADASNPDAEGVFRELRWYWYQHAFPRRSPRALLKLERHNAMTLRKHLEAFRPEVACWWAMGGMSLSLLELVRRSGLPAVSVVVDDWLHYGPLVDAWARYTRRLPAPGTIAGVPVGIDVQRTATWLFASEALRRGAEAAGWAVDGATVAYPGVDHDLFTGAREPREDWGWRLLYCGRIDERKGIDTAIEALPRLPDGARLTVLGGGDEDHLAELRDLAARLGVHDRVSFERRRRHELPQAYAEADVTLFPVRWEEPFGLVPLESMAMGTPVVATGRGGSGEYLRDGENSVLFDSEGGAEALATALGRLAGDAPLRARIHSGGLNAAARFSDEVFDRAVEQLLLRSVAAAPSRRRQQAGS